MPFRTTCERDHLHVEFEGTVSHDEVIDANRVLFEHPRFDSLRHCTCDFTRVTELHVSRELVEYSAALAKGGSYSNARLKLAFSASDPEYRAVINSYIDCVRALAGTWDIRLFGCPKEARGWLGL
ncbi:MAG: hypothetical protein IPL06_12400 [Betaproteobacteria bacterium]|nr:hypothetical protein [Betaproteobacteria bacterium]